MMDDEMKTMMTKSTQNQSRSVNRKNHRLDSKQNLNSIEFDGIKNQKKYNGKTDMAKSKERWPGC